MKGPPTVPYHTDLQYSVLFGHSLSGLFSPQRPPLNLFTLYLLNNSLTLTGQLGSTTAPSPVATHQLENKHAKAD